MKTKIFTENGREYIIIVKPTLHYIKYNKAPYFSITAEIWRSKNGRKVGRDCESCGCLYDDIEKHFPEYTDIIKLHLSDINGMPMYAVENGWYWYQQDKNKGLDYCRIPASKRDRIYTNKQEWVDLVNSMVPVYKAEAIQCIERHNLSVTGDVWNEEVPHA